MNNSCDLSALVEILAKLRDPVRGCAWDLAQDHVSIAPYAIEEAYEVVDAIERGDPHDLCDELGDLLLQVVFHSRIAQESGHFALGDVVDAVSSKMVRRHPHVFGPLAETGERPDWEQQKESERADRSGASVLDGVPVTLPATTRALKLQKKAARVGFDWNDAGSVVAKIREELGEIEAEIASKASADRISDEVGDLFFAVVNLARHLGIDPEAATRGANAKFLRRFGYIEQQLAGSGKHPRDSTLNEMEALWTEAKRSGL